MKRKAVVGYLLAVLAFAAVGEDIVLTEDTEITVPAGETNVVETLGGSEAWTLTKKGGGVLEIHRVANAKAKIVIAEGEFFFVNARPTDIFRKAYFHVDASDLSTMEIETVNGTNFVSRWNDVNGGIHYATNCMTRYVPWDKPESGSGAGHEWPYGVLRTEPENRRPFISKVSLNGLPVMDFGSLLSRWNTNEQAKALGYGAAMNLDQLSPRVEEGFTVAADTDDIAVWPTVKGLDWEKMYAQSYFCNENGTAWCWRGNYLSTAGDSPFLDYNSRITGIIAMGNAGRGLFVDGEPTNYTSAGPSPEPGFHLVRVQTKTGGNYSPYVDALAANHCYEANLSDVRWPRVYGGQRIAEYAIFTNHLSDVEAAIVTRYLTTKWLTDEIVLPDVTVKSGAKFSVDANLNVKVSRYQDESGADVSVGRGCALRTGVLLSSGAAFHLDGADTNTMEIVTENGTNYVTRWNDPSGNGFYAEASAYGGFYGQRRDYEKRRPFLNPTLTQNGHVFVDLGSPIYNGYTNEAGLAIGHGAALSFANVSFRQALMVVSDVEEVKKTPSDAGYTGLFDKSGPSLFANVDVKSTGENGTFAGRRGTLLSGSHPTLFATQSTEEGKAVYEGTWLVDGEAVEDSAKKTYRPPDGFFVLDLSPTAETSANRFGRSARNNTAVPKPDTFGGLRYAEVLFFSEPLDATAQTALYDALRTKWYGDEVKHTRSYSNLKVPATSSFSVEYENLAVAGTLTLGGKVTAPAVSAANMTVTDSAEVNATLSFGENAVLAFGQTDDGAFTTLKATSVVLPAAATVRFSLADAKSLKGKSVRIIESTEITGSTVGWSVEATGFTAGVKLTVKPDGLYADFPKSGLMLILR